MKKHQSSLARGDTLIFHKIGFEVYLFVLFTYQLRQSHVGWNKVKQPEIWVYFSASGIDLLGCVIQYDSEYKVHL